MDQLLQGVCRCPISDDEASRDMRSSPWLREVERSRRGMVERMWCRGREMAMGGLIVGGEDNWICLTSKVAALWMCENSKALRARIEQLSRRKDCHGLMLTNFLDGLSKLLLEWR